MAQQYWHKQVANQPLFPELIWSRPEHKNQAGKLLIIGGNSWGFAAPALAYEEATKAGVGTARVLLPAAIHKLIGHTLDHAESAASTPSGSFAKTGLNEWLVQAAWADAVLLAGDLGRNSETAILLEQFITKYGGQVTLTKDAVDYSLHIAEQLLTRPDTTLVLSMSQLQKLVMAAHFDQAITTSMDLIRLVDTLHHFTQKYPINIVVKQAENLVVAVEGQVSTTKLIEELPIWRVKTAAHAAVWQLQNPEKVFAALSTAMLG